MSQKIVQLDFLKPEVKNYEQEKERIEDLTFRTLQAMEDYIKSKDSVMNAMFGFIKSRDKAMSLIMESIPSLQDMVLHQNDKIDRLAEK